MIQVSTMVGLCGVLLGAFCPSFLASPLPCSSRYYHCYETDTKTGIIDHVDFPQVFEILIDLIANTINFVLGRALGKDHHKM